MVSHLDDTHNTPEVHKKMDILSGRYQTSSCGPRILWKLLWDFSRNISPNLFLFSWRVLQIFQKALCVIQLDLWFQLLTMLLNLIYDAILLEQIALYVKFTRILFRIITGLRCNSFRTKLYDELGWDLLQTRRKVHELILFYKKEMLFTQTFVRFDWTLSSIKSLL